MAVRREVFEAVGGFDVRIGTGSPGKIQSGEGADLVARCLRLCAVQDLTGLARTFERSEREFDVPHIDKRLKYALGPVFVLAANRGLGGRRLALMRCIVGGYRRFGFRSPILGFAAAFALGRQVAHERSV